MITAPAKFAPQICPIHPPHPLPRAAALVLQILTARARGRKHYQTAAAAEAELRTLTQLGEPIDTGNGRRFKLVDTFEGQDTVKKMTFIDRFDLVEIKG